MSTGTRSAIGGVALALCLSSAAGFAFSTGITSASFGLSGCNACHSGGVQPTVTLTPSSTAPDAGLPQKITVAVTTPNGQHAGFNLRASSGTLSVLSGTAGIQILGGEATHNYPHSEGIDGLVKFEVEWTAASGGPVTFTAWGNSVNYDGVNTGDLANGAQSDICVSSTFFRDADGDDAGVATTTQDGCTAPAGYSPNAGDCDDGNPAVRPGAAEVCNGADDDCDGTADEGPPPCQTGVCVSGACVVDAGTDGGEDSGSGSGGDGGTDPTDAGSADASDGGGDPPVCGCSGAPSAAFWVPALVLLVALRRRTAYDARPGRTGATHLRSPGRR